MTRCDKCGIRIPMFDDVYSGCGNPDDCSCRYCGECADYKYPETSVLIERRAAYTEADALWERR